MRTYLLLPILITLLLQESISSASINDSIRKNARRNLMVGTISGGTYVGSFVALYDAWYKDYNTASFHFFNDNKEWKGMDKCGHFATAYWASRLSSETWKWAGNTNEKSRWLGISYAMLFLTTVEVFDGFSAGWGFSYGDMLSNISGGLLFYGQDQCWNEQRIIPKISYTESEYAQYRPNLLGKNTAEKLLKDYNAQTYWLSCNISSFLPDQNKFPAWLNIAVGYGADGMLGGHENPLMVKGAMLPYFQRRRQYYISLDADLSKIKTRHKWLKTTLYVLNMIKIPAPTLEFTQGEKIRIHPIYF